MQKISERSTMTSSIPPKLSCDPVNECPGRRCVRARKEAAENRLRQAKPNDRMVTPAFPFPVSRPRACHEPSLGSTLGRRGGGDDTSRGKIEFLVPEERFTARLAPRAPCRGCSGTIEKNGGSDAVRARRRKMPGCLAPSCLFPSSHRWMPVFFAEKDHARVWLPDCEHVD